MALDLPDLNLPDSLNSLAMMANQLQVAINWAIAHPLWAVITILLTITLIQIIADLIKRFVKAALTFTLKLPLTLSQWIWQRATAPSAPNTTDQIQQLISQLESLRTEQDHIMAQLKSLLSDSANKQQAIEQPTEQPGQPAATEARKSSPSVSPEVG